MQLLLDTHIYLWIYLWSVSNDPRLSKDARVLMASATAIYVSSISLWEIAIKVRQGKLQADLVDLVDKLEPSGFLPLPVLPIHAVPIAAMPLHHRDPFDRMLVAQATAEQLWLLTADAQLSQYSNLVIRV
jgi:PIN domain nuclease of toxin-antitoxin system